MSEVRLIDANAYREKAGKHWPEEWLDILDDMPTIEPVKHGKWIEAMYGEMHLYPDGQKMCNVCNTIMPSAWNTMPPFCFGCGAQMDGEV